MKNLLLEIKETIFPSQSGTHIRHYFTVDENFFRIELDFSYCPKYLEDSEQAEAYLSEGMRKFAPPPYGQGYGDPRSCLPLVNLITLSIDAPDGYRGCAHRHDPVQHHQIASGMNSYGFSSGAIPSGKWCAVISVHAVVTKGCTYQLKIMGVPE